MVKILDQYLLKKFAYACIFVLLILTAVIVLIDFTEKNAYLLPHKLPYREILHYYYYGYIPFIINLIIPISVFVTTVFVTSRLAQRTEIIAMLGNGISFSRFLVPYLIVATGISLCSFGLTGWWLAKANKVRVAFDTTYINQFFHHHAHHLHIKISPNQYFYVQHYWPHNNLGVNVTIDTIEDNQLLERCSAQRIQWLQAENKWELQKWTIRKIDGLKEHIQQGDKLNYAMQVHPHDFNMNPQLHKTLTLPELTRHITALRSKGADSVHIFLAEKYSRYAYPCSAIILTAIGGILSARKTRNGSGLQLALGFILAFTYIIFLLFSKGVAEAKGTQLLLIIWMPNVIFASLGVVLYRFVPK